LARLWSALQKLSRPNGCSLISIADNLSKAGWSCGCVLIVDYRGRTIFVVDAHRGDGERFVVRADEKITAFLELEAATRQRLWRLARSSTNHSTNPWWPLTSVARSGSLAFSLDAPGVKIG
jgi:hypothetical protein